MKTYVVYILSNKPRGTLYIGVTNNLKRRMIEHRDGLVLYESIFGAEEKMDPETSSG